MSVTVRYALAPVFMESVPDEAAVEFGTRSSWLGRCKHSLKPGGVFVTNDLGFLWQVPLLVALTSRIGDKKVLLPIGPPTTKQDVLLVKGLIEAGKYRAVLDRCYPMAQVVEAARYVETRRKTGNVVLTIGGERG